MSSNDSSKKTEAAQSSSPEAGKNVPFVKKSEEALREAHKKWMEHFSGPLLSLPVSLGSPSMARIYKRNFNMTSRDIYYISVLGRALLGDAESKKAEEYVLKNLANSLREVQDMITQAEASLLNAGITQLATYQNPRLDDARITTPASKQFIDLLHLADKYLLALHTLWLNVVIDNDQRAAHELIVKIKVKSVSNSARQMYSAMLNELNARNNGAATKTILNYGKTKAAKPEKESVKVEPPVEPPVEHPLPIQKAA